MQVKLHEAQGLAEVSTVKFAYNAPLIPTRCVIVKRCAYSRATSCGVLGAWFPGYV